MAADDSTIDARAGAPTAAESGAGAATADGDGEPGSGGFDGPAIGRFLVGGVLGQGGMGVVMRARDPELGRQVAIKLLHPGQRGHAGLRLGREAQAMAKLSHPNVVNVYDVGEHDGSMYIAMELVDGSTLRAWRKAAARTWREVLDIYLAAGRGLAAAHAAGLVHRDFKPDNVLVGSDGRPRVTDFGLVAADGRAVESGDTRGAALDANLTVQGSVLGTPPYMAPEQWRGETVDPRTDQFAFCVALWEALHGERPFAGDTTTELRAAILEGVTRPPRQRVPRWLTAALQRGLAKDPAARWPSLRELLDHLARPRRGTWIAAAAAAVALGGAGVAFVAWPQEQAASCRAHARRMEAVWDDAQREQVRRLGALGNTNAILQLDVYAERWVETRVAVCEDERRTNRPAAVRAVAAHCFDDALADLDQIARGLVAGDLTWEQRAAAVDALPNVASCADVSVLTAVAPRPTDPARARRLAAVEATLVRARAADRLGRLEEARDLAAGVLAEAEDIGYAPTLSEARRVAGSARTALGDHAGAEADFRASLRAADAGRDDRARLDAYHGLLIALAELRRFDEAETVIADARSTLTRIASPVEYEIVLSAYESDLHAAQGNLSAAMDSVRRAMSLHAEEYGTADRSYAELQVGLANLLLATGDVDAAEPLLEDARAVMVEHIGPDAPTIAKIDNSRSFVRYARGDLAGAIAILEPLLARRERVEGADNLALSNLVYTLGAYYGGAERFDESIQMLRRALELNERKHGKDHRAVAMVLNELVQSLLAKGLDTEAAAYAARLYDLIERIEISPHTESIARHLYAQTLWPAQKQRSRALARQARDELRAQGDEQGARQVEIWLQAH